MKELALALIVSIASEYGIPPGFMESIVEVENPSFDPDAVNVNANGSRDTGLMQLNSSWYSGDVHDIEEHIREAARFIKDVHENYGWNWWQTAVAYNCGVTRLLTGSPPDASITYANKVFEVWNAKRRYAY
jgi:soluble lytic murein transglycosylase-like protein